MVRSTVAEGQMSTNAETREFRLTGWHVLAICIAFFLSIFAANGALVYYALGSFPGVATDSPYRVSQTYNAEIAAANAQTARGWHVDATAKRDPDGHALVAVSARDAAGRPVTGVAFKAELQHPMNRAQDRKLVLGEVAGASGTFSGKVEDLPAGQWELVIEGDGKGGRLFLSQSRLILR